MKIQLELVMILQVKIYNIEPIYYKKRIKNLFLINEKKGKNMIQ